MNSRINMAAVVLLFGVTVFATSTAAQRRRMSEHGPAARIGLASRPDTRRSLARIRGGGFFPRSVLLPPYFPYFYPAYDFNEYEPIATPAPPLQVIAAQPAPAPA